MLCSGSSCSFCCSVPSVPAGRWGRIFCLHPHTPYSRRMWSPGRSSLEPAQDVGHRTPSTPLTGALCSHSSSETEVISSHTWQLDFPSDLYKPEVSWEVSQLHHSAFGVYSYSNQLLTFIPSWCSGCWAGACLHMGPSDKAGIWPFYS